MKIGLMIIGALIGPIVGFFGTCFVYCALPHNSCPVGYMGEALPLSFFVGAPLGLVTFCLLGRWLGNLLEPKTKDEVAARNEELKMLAERGEIVKVRVELTSFLNHDAIRRDLETAGFVEIEERTPLGKLFSSGSVKCVTGTVDPIRIEELAALSFVKSVQGEGSTDGRSG